MVIMMTTCCLFLHVCYWKCIDKPPQAMHTGWSTQFRPEQPDCMDHLVNNCMCRLNQEFIILQRLSYYYELLTELEITI